jgi:hypothetical protein
MYVPNDYHHWVEKPTDILLKVAITQNVKLLKNSALFDPVHDLVRLKIENNHIKSSYYRLMIIC